MAAFIRRSIGMLIIPLVAGLAIGFAVAPQPVRGDNYEIDCHNFTDDDEDTMVDCEDVDDCSLSPYCEEICDNGEDDDGDSAVDCNDIWCQVYSMSC